MGKFNINLGKVVMTDLVNKVTNIASSIKYKNEEEPIIYDGPPVSEKEKLSPFDSRCKQELIAKVSLVFSDNGMDSNGEQYLVEQHEIIYIDGSSKIFETKTSPSYVSITEVKKEKVSKK